MLVLGINILRPPTLSKSIGTTFNKTATCPNPPKPYFSLTLFWNASHFLILHNDGVMLEALSQEKRQGWRSCVQSSSICKLLNSKSILPTARILMNWGCKIFTTLRPDTGLVNRSLRWRVFLAVFRKFAPTCKPLGATWSPNGRWRSPLM